MNAVDTALDATAAYWPVAIVVCVVVWTALRELGPIRRLRRLVE